MAESGNIVQAIKKPLGFASKNGFANLPHVKGLEKLIADLGNRALSMDLAPSQKRLFHELMEVFSGFEGSPTEEKKERITQSMRLMMQLEGYRGEAEEKPRGFFIAWTIWPHSAIPFLPDTFSGISPPGTYTNWTHNARGKRGEKLRIWDFGFRISDCGSRASYQDMVIGYS